MHGNCLGSRERAHAHWFCGRGAVNSSGVGETFAPQELFPGYSTAGEAREDGSVSRVSLAECAISAYRLQSEARMLEPQLA
jgi:hypothetical protein